MGGGKGIQDIRQQAGFVKWNVSISPFTASMSMSIKVPEHTRSSGVLKEAIQGRNRGTMGQRAKTASLWVKGPKNMAVSHSRNLRIMPVDFK